MDARRRRLRRGRGRRPGCRSSTTCSASSAATGGSTSRVAARGDLEVDAHHTVEDVGIVLGEALAEALGDKAGIRRFGSIALPLDEALVEVALDLSGRPYLAYDIDFPPDTNPLGSPPFDPQLAEEFWRAFATAATSHPAPAAGAGKNTHHIVEASFKGVARALRDAVRLEGGGVPSTKGTPVRVAGRLCRPVPPSRPDTRPVVIAVLDYGIGNLRSAEKALQYLGAEAELVADPDRAAGAAGDGAPRGGRVRPVRARRSAGPGLDRAATVAIERGVPFLGICVGFQLLYEGSEEDPADPGLGVLPGMVRRLPDRGQAPADAVEPARSPSTAPDSGLLAGVPDPAWVYFVHSYAPELTADTSSTCDYGGPVTAAAERGRSWGTQFHPEKSGPIGPRTSWPTSCAPSTPSGLMELYPAIDIRDGGAVRLTQGDFDRQQRLRRPGRARPAGSSRRGARWLHVVDLDAARTGRAGQPRPWCRHRRGGRRPGPGRRRGAQPTTDAEELLDGGVARVVLGTAALDDRRARAPSWPRLPRPRGGGARLPPRCGRANRGRRPGLGAGQRAHGRRGARRLADAGLAAVVRHRHRPRRHASRARPRRVGARCSGRPTLPVIASGGVGARGRHRGARRPGGRERVDGRRRRRVAGVIAGRALVDGRMTVEEGVAACARSG